MKKIRINLKEEDLETLKKYNLSASKILEKVIKKISEENIEDSQEFSLNINFNNSQRN